MATSPGTPGGTPGSDGAIRLSVDGPVATITIDRPGRRNALRWDMVTALRNAVADVAANDTARVVVLTGAGDRAFCAGVDLATMAGGDDPGATSASRAELAALFGDLWALGKPTIAAVAGYALAGGMGLALACDLVVATEDATFGVPEIDVGLWPFMVTVPLLRSMPPKVALELMMTGRRVPAAEAQAMGFVNRVVPAAGLTGAVADIASVLATKPPGAMAAGRTSFYDTLDLTSDVALARLCEQLSVVAEGAEAAEGMAAFAEKRPPAWRTNPEGNPT
jgi:enoyl-CoA hydratase/carnithine racemase